MEKILTHRRTMDIISILFSTLVLKQTITRFYEALLPNIRNRANSYFIFFQYILRFSSENFKKHKFHLFIENILTIRRTMDISTLFSTAVVKQTIRNSYFSLCYAISKKKFLTHL